MSYIDAAREIAERGAAHVQRGRAVTAVAERKGGLGRGLAALIPTGSAGAGRQHRSRTSRTGRSSRADSRQPAPTAVSAPCPHALRARRSAARPGGGRVLPRDRRRPRSGPTRSSRAARSTRRHWPSWSTPSGSSACCSRSWCASSTAGRTSWSWASAGGGPRSAPGWSGCRRSCAAPATTRCCATRCWRTSTGSSSTRSTRRRPTSSCSPSSASPTTELADRLGRSRPVVTNTIRLLKLPVSVQRRVAAGVLSAGHARALLGWTTRSGRRSWPRGSSPRACRCGPPRKPWCWPGGTRRRRRRSTRRRPMHAPGLQDLAERLSDTFDTRVKVELGQRKGRIVVEFGSVEDLERIARMMDPAAQPADDPANRLSRDRRRLVSRETARVPTSRSVRAAAQRQSRPPRRPSAAATSRSSPATRSPRGSAPARRRRRSRRCGTRRAARAAGAPPARPPPTPSDVAASSRAGQWKVAAPGV